jgi:hypothetical protein
MAELVDAPASGAGAGNGVEVRVLFRAPFLARTFVAIATASLFRTPFLALCDKSIGYFGFGVIFVALKIDVNRPAFLLMHISQRRNG